jgi:hypothetical protein
LPILHFPSRLEGLPIMTKAVTVYKAYLAIELSRDPVDP